jgi:hypothetical protein
MTTETIVLKYMIEVAVRMDWDNQTIDVVPKTSYPVKSGDMRDWTIVKKSTLNNMTKKTKKKEAQFEFTRGDLVTL